MVLTPHNRDERARKKRVSKSGEGVVVNDLPPYPDSDVRAAEVSTRNSSVSRRAADIAAGA